MKSFLLILQSFAQGHFGERFSFCERNKALSFWSVELCTRLLLNQFSLTTLASGIDVGQGIKVGPGKFGKKNKRRALNTHVLCSK